MQYVWETLWHELDELEGLILVCDCPLAQTCEADLLAAGGTHLRQNEHGRAASSPTGGTGATWWRVRGSDS